MNLKNTVTHPWDRWAYRFRVVRRPGIEHIEFWDGQLIEFLVHVLDLKPGMRLLDVACGSGVHALALAHQEIEVVGRTIRALASTTPSSTSPTTTA